MTKRMDIFRQKLNELHKQMIFNDHGKNKRKQFIHFLERYEKLLVELLDQKNLKTKKNDLEAFLKNTNIDYLNNVNVNYSLDFIIYLILNNLFVPLTQLLNRVISNFTSGQMPLQTILTIFRQSKYTLAISSKEMLQDTSLLQLLQKTIQLKGYSEQLKKSDIRGVSKQRLQFYSELLSDYYMFKKQSDMDSKKMLYNSIAYRLMKPSLNNFQELVINKFKQKIQVQLLNNQNSSPLNLCCRIFFRQDDIVNCKDKIFNQIGQAPAKIGTLVPKINSLLHHQLKKTVISYLNSDSGGIVYLGLERTQSEQQYRVAGISFSQRQKGQFALEIYRMVYEIHPQSPEKIKTNYFNVFSDAIKKSVKTYNSLAQLYYFNRYISLEFHPIVSKNSYFDYSPQNSLKKKYIIKLLVKPSLKVDTFFMIKKDQNANSSYSEIACYKRTEGGAVIQVHNEQFVKLFQMRAELYLKRQQKQQIRCSPTCLFYNNNTIYKTQQ